MDKIEALLAELNSEAFENVNADEDQPSSFVQLSTNNSGDPSVDTKESNEQEDNYESTKKENCSKYSTYGYEIHKKLKDSYSSNNTFNVSKCSWFKSNTGKSTLLSAPKSAIEGKSDIYGEPTFGLQLVNPLVSVQFIQTKMTGKQPVAVSDIASHLNHGNKNVDWVFAGVIVFKSGMKTSQKGKQYCFWKISDLKHDLKEVTVYLFSSACSDLIKTSIGTVVAILNATPFHKEENVSKNDLTLMVRNSDQIMIWGGSRDYGICKAKKKNGENCTAFVNKRQCEFCLYHVKNEYNKYSSKRHNLFGTASTGPNGLRNKVLGKSEVFYGGRSFTAIKAATNSKLEKRDSQLLNMLSSNSVTKNKKLIEADKERLEALSQTSGKPLENFNILKPLETERKSGKKAKVISSRLHLFKEAGLKMLKTGETTRVTYVNLEKKKKSDLSFANMFTLEPTSGPAILGELSRKINTNCIPKEKPNSTDFIIELPTLNLSQKLCRKPEELASSIKNLPHKNSKSLSNKDSASGNLQMAISSSSKTSSTRSCKDFVSLANKLSSSVNEAKVQTPSSQIKSKETENRIIEKESIKSKSDEFVPTKSPAEMEEKSKICDHKEKENIDSNESSHCPRNNLNAPVLQQLRSSLVSANIHERKKMMTKINAITLIKRKGGLTKTDPNRVKPSEKSKKNVKRRLEEDDQDPVEKNLNSKPVLSKRFIDLMNATSKHENLVKIAEDIEQQNYFNKMEKKEQLEEKMLNTFKVPCKAVTCLKCKYKWFSASDLCRAECHPIKVVDAIKRFFQCSNCSNRTVSLDVIPLVSCQNCGSSNWSRAAMIRERIVGANNSLCIRGDEQKFVDSLSGKCSLNLLVPE